MGWLCSYTPLEIILAAGFQPYRLSGHSDPIEKADSYIHPNYCQFVKSTIDVAITGGYDFLEGVIFVNSCDAMRRLHDVWKKHVPTKFIYMLDLPMGNMKKGEEYLKKEFEKLKVALEKYTSRTIDDSTIEDAINVCAKSREIFSELNALRKQRPTPIKGTEIFTLISEFFTTSPSSWNEKVRTFIKDKQDAMQSQAGSASLPRVLLAGSPLHDPRFISFIEDCGLDVISEELCTGTKFFDVSVKKSNDVLGALSAAYLNRVPCARMMKIEERLAYLLKIVKEFNIDGIIHQSLKFCDVYLYDVPRLKDLLNEHDIRSLFIETDGGLGSMNQLKTRIEAFAEILS